MGKGMEPSKFRNLKKYSEGYDKIKRTNKNTAVKDKKVTATKTTYVY